MSIKLKMYAYKYVKLAEWAHLLLISNTVKFDAHLKNSLQAMLNIQQPFISTYG